MDEYVVLDQDERDEIIVSYLKAQERDLFCHRINLERYNEMLKTLPEGKFKSHINDLRLQTLEKLSEVESIINATKRQLPPLERINTALMRINQKEIQYKSISQKNTDNKQ